MLYCRSLRQCILFISAIYQVISSFQRLDKMPPSPVHTRPHWIRQINLPKRFCSFLCSDNDRNMRTTSVYSQLRHNVQEHRFIYRHRRVSNCVILESNRLYTFLNNCNLGVFENFLLATKTNIPHLPVNIQEGDKYDMIRNENQLI